MRHLSKRANQVLKLAQEAADEYEQGYVGTEHLLLGIVREGTSLGARILFDHGATEYRIKSVVDELVSDRVHETWVTGRLPGSPHFIDVFARAERIAKRLGQAPICAEHLLAALMTETGSVGYEALRALGLSREAIEDAFHGQVA
jgi:ATP-dependent Clp protease ATP-binding subunit ClpC